MHARFFRLIYGILLAAALYGFLVWLSGFILIRSIEARYGLEVHGLWYPTRVVPGFLRIQRPQIRWKERLTLNSSVGELNIRFNPIFHWSGTAVLWVTGKNLQVEFGKRYSNAVEGGLISIDEISVRIELPKLGEPVIRDLEIKSPMIQFQMKAK